jgi:hypothetical protein
MALTPSPVQPASLAGTIVFYKLAKWNCVQESDLPGSKVKLARQGEYRPALVVVDWGKGHVNLLVFLDGANDVDAPFSTAVFPTTLWVASAQEGTDEGTYATSLP